jgi:hypothetical protein
LEAKGTLLFILVTHIHVSLFIGEDVAFGRPGLLTDFSVRGENELEVSSEDMAKGTLL